MDEILARINAGFAASYPDLAAQGFRIDWDARPLLDTLIERHFAAVNSCTREHGLHREHGNG